MSPPAPKLTGPARTIVGVFGHSQFEGHRPLIDDCDMADLIAMRLLMSRSEELDGRKIRITVELLDDDA